MDLSKKPTPEGDVTLGVRPEDLYTEGNAPSTKRLSDPFVGTVEVEEPMGNEVVAYVRIDPDNRLVARLEPQPIDDGEDAARLRIDLDKIHLFDAETGRALAA